MSQRLQTVSSALDVQTGGGEILVGAASFPPAMAATESWAPNLDEATRRLARRGVVVVAEPHEPSLPFADKAFEMMTSRYPATVWWSEITRVLKPGGSYFAQHVGPDSAFELVEYFLGGPLWEACGRRHSAREGAEATAAGLEIADVRCQSLRMEFSTSPP